MERLFLVQPKNGLNETIYVPLGLISLAAYVREEMAVRIVDLRFDSLESLYCQIEKERPLAVGFSMLTGSCITQVVAAAKKVKSQFPEIKIIVGGIHPTFFPQQTLENPYIDFVVMSEGEKTLLELLRALREGKTTEGVENLGWKDKNGIHINSRSEKFLDLNTLPIPAWDLIDVERYVQKLSHMPRQRVIDMYTSKGCPFPCSFCYNLNFNRRQWRAKSPEKAVDEIAMLNQRYGINYFIIHDDNFVVDKRRALAIAQLIRKRGFAIRYSIDARIDYFERNFLQEMQESGLREIRVGCESGSNRVLAEVIQKGITKEQTRAAIKLAHDLDLHVLLSFVIGWPTETVAERQETIELILELQKINPHINIYPLWVYIPYPGTTLFNRAVELGFKQPTNLEAWGSYFWGKAHLPWLSAPREYEMIHELSTLAWHNRPWDSRTPVSLRNIAKFIFMKVFRPMVLFRFTHNFWKFPLDVRMITGLKARVSRQ